MKDLLQRVANCASKRLSAYFYEENEVLRLYRESDYCDILADGSTVQNASGLMVLIECMANEYKRLDDMVSHSNNDIKRYELIEDKLDSAWALLNTRVVCEAFCEVFE